MKLNLLLAACFIIFLPACGSLKNNRQHSVADSRINNVVWSIISFKGRVINEKDFPGSAPSLVFNMQDNKISGSDGCNNFMGIARYTGNIIKAGPIASTKMACQNTIIQKDLYDILASNDLMWRLNNDGILRLFVNDAEVMALKERQ